MANLTESTPVITEQLVDVKGIDVIRFKITTKEVELPSYKEVEIAKPVFKSVEIAHPIFKDVEVEVPRLSFKEQDITQAIRTLLEGEIKTAVHTIVTRMKFDIKIVPGDKGISVSMEARDGE